MINKSQRNNQITTNNALRVKVFTDKASKEKLLKAYDFIRKVSEAFHATRPKEPAHSNNEPTIGLLSKSYSDYMEYIDDLNKWRNSITEELTKISHPKSEISSALGNQNVKEIFNILERQAKRRKDRFAHEMAPLELLEVFVDALLNYYVLSQDTKFIKYPTKSNWQSTIDAVSCLINEINNGIPLYLVGSRINMFDLSLAKLKLLKKELKDTAKRTPKKHTDQYLTERQACRYFVHRLCHNFSGVAPPAIVIKFCELINYESEKVERLYIKQWTNELLNKTT